MVEYSKNHWERELSASKKRQENWRKDTDETLDIYEGKKKKVETNYNILFANTEFVTAMLFNSMPIADIRPRWRQDNKIIEDASKVLERAVQYFLSDETTEQTLELDVIDYATGGRCNSRVVYDPTLIEVPVMEIVEQEVYDEDGNFVDITTVEQQVVDQDKNPVTEFQVEDESVYIDYVDKNDFEHGYARVWSNVPWVGYRHKYTKEELQEKFGESFLKMYKENITEAIDVTEQYDKEDSKDNIDKGTQKYISVYEIWDKTNRQVLYIATCWKKGPLKVVDSSDYLDLRRFFPAGDPAYIISSTRTLEPIPYRKIYQNQLKELGKITKRINDIVDRIRVRFVYDSQITELAQMLSRSFDGKDGIPIENPVPITEAGGIANAVEFFPIEKWVTTLQPLYQARQQIIHEIYEIMGISDLMRAATKASETATAQRLKNVYGSVRLQKAQKTFQKYVRGHVRVMAEIIAEKFEIETLKAITGFEFDDQYWEQIMNVLRDDHLRSYNVDIQTDSTIQELLDRDLEGMAKVVNGLAQWWKVSAPLVAQGFVEKSLIIGFSKEIIRRLRLGRAIEEHFNKAAAEENVQVAQQQLEQAQETMLQAVNQKLQQLAQAEQQVNQQTQAVQQQAQQLEQTKAEIQNQSQRDIGAVITQLQQLSQLVAQDDKILGGKIDSIVNIIAQKEQM